MSENAPARSPSPAPTPPRPPEPADSDWQPLPLRARALFVFGTAIWLAIPGAAIGGLLGLLMRGFVDLPLLDAWGVPAGALTGVSLGGLFGIWWGFKRYRHSLWKHDALGLAVRSGKLWRRETRVPATRVQHLDIKRGPWQRRRRLSTLVVHTAGTKHSAVMVPHLDVDDAERLRDSLARQVDHDDDF